VVTQERSEKGGGERQVGEGAEKKGERGGS